MTKRQHPDISDTSMSAMREQTLKIYEVKRDEPGGLTDRLVVIYHKHLSADDVKEILKFFSTPIGQKVKGFLAVRQVEALPIVEQWSDEVARDKLTVEYWSGGQLKTAEVILPERPVLQGDFKRFDRE